MPKGIYAAVSAMVTETRALDVTSQNLANLQTSGYRRQVALHGTFAERLAGEGRTGGVAGEGGTGVYPTGSYFVFSEGNQDITGSPLDMALSGHGFYRVRDPNGRPLLTRCGNFSVNEQGNLVTPEGFTVEGQGGTISIPPEAQHIEVDERGGIYAKSPGVPGGTFVDLLRVVEVEHPERMRARSGQYFEPGEQTQTDVGSSDFTVHQGYLERSNVNSVQELVTMIAIQRRYDAAQKAVHQNDATGRDFSDLLRGA